MLCMQSNSEGGKGLLWVRLTSPMVSRWGYKSPLTLPAHQGWKCVHIFHMGESPMALVLRTLMEGKSVHHELCCTYSRWLRHVTCLVPRPRPVCIVCCMKTNRKLDWEWGHTLTAVTVKALINVPLNNNYDLQRCLVQSKKNYFGPLGVPCLERRLRVRVQLRPFPSDLQRPSYNRPKWRCRMRTRLEVHLDCCCCCEQRRNSTTTTVEELVVLKVIREVSLNRKHPSKNIYVAKRHPH